MHRSTWIVVLLVLSAGCATPGGSTESEADTSWVPPSDPELVALRDEAVTILDTFCAACHAGDAGAAALDLRKTDMESRLIDVPSTQVDTLRLVDTIAPERSYLVMKMRGTKGIVGQRMPLGGRISEEFIEDVEAWVAALAEFRAGTRPDTTAPAEK